jgi:hypothetical protein
VGVCAAAGLAAAALALGPAGQASTPTSGSVSDTSPVTSWGGGPFAAPNTTGTATGTPDCTAPSSCDDFTLHVSTPAGYDADHSLKIDVSWSNTAADFDLYVLDKAGNTVATSASSADPEEVVLPPTTGDYTVRVVPFTPLGESYSAKAEIVGKPAAPAPGTNTPPGFANYPAPSSLKDANNAGEPSIGTNWGSGASMYQAYLSTYRVKFDDSTSPATATWSATAARRGAPTAWTRSCSPTTRPDGRSSRS